SDLKEQIDQSASDINSLLSDINAINKQIAKIEPHGMLSNDLYDERDRLIDQLSQHMNIKVHRTKSSESAPDIADGLISIELVDDTGKSIDGGVFLVDARDRDLENAVNELTIEPGALTQGAISDVKIGGNSLGVDKILTS